MGMGGQIGSVIWLWRAHNAVTHRLRVSEIQSDGESGRSPTGFPDVADCEACYNVTSNAILNPEELQAGTAVAAQATEHTVFEYLQEVYCFESDTYVCATFDDPSKNTDSRNKAEL